MDEMSEMKNEKPYTIEDIYALPEGQRAELINGVWYDLAAPTATHQQILGNVFAAIHTYLKEKNGPCRVYPAPFAVFLKADEYTYLEPDISVVCDPSKVDERGCVGAPDWVIEIVSPGSRRMDYLVKTHLYQNAGVKLYWIVDLKEKIVTVDDFEHGEVEHHAFGEPIPVSMYPGLTVTV